MMAMKQLRIKDNSLREKGEFSAVSRLTARLADKTLGQLEREGIFAFPNFVNGTDGLTKDQVVLQSVNESYRSGNVMGFLGYGDERLAIESRFSTGENDFFLQYLLERVLNFPTVVELETNADPNNKLLMLLVFLFPGYLKNAVRKGLFKTYIRREYNDSNPKGTINIARHLKENTPFMGKIAYAQREYSYDNYLMELIRHTIEHIKSQPYGYDMLATIKDEVKVVVEATEGYRPSDRQKVLAENQKNVIRHAYFREYRALQQLCILILQNRKHQIGSGTNRVFGILFDGAWLWEEYIHLLVEDIFYHPRNKNGGGAQRLFSTESGKIGLIYPDFIGKDEKRRIIADAKYKPVENIGNHDYFQVLAYMLRFDGKKGFYFYPESHKSEDLVLWVNSGSTYEDNVTPRQDLCVIKHGLKIPQGAASYSAFAQMMKQSEIEFVNGLTSL